MTEVKKTARNIILSGAAIIAIASIASRLLGLIRDRVLSSSFGAGPELDAYFAAFRIPDTIFNLIVLGSVSAAFIPIFTDLITHKKDKEAWAVTNSVLNIILFFIIVISLVLLIFMPTLVNLIFHEFDESTRILTVNLTRIMLLSPIFFGISTIAGNILNSYKKFLVYSLAPIMYNVGIIAGALILIPYIGIYGAAVGVVVGAFMHMAIQLPSIKKLGYAYRFTFHMYAKVKLMLILMIPRFIGVATSQIELFVSTYIASTLAVGSVTVYNFANNIQSLPYSVFGVSLATASFPILAQAASQNHKKDFVKSFSDTLMQILFFIIPVTILMILFRAQIVRVLLGAGQFDWQDTVDTAQTLGYFSISLFAQALIPLLARAFYSLKDTKTPVIIGMISVALNVGLSFYLAPIFGVAGLGMAFSAASFLNVILLMIFLHWRFGYLNDSVIIKSVVKMLVATVVMGLVLQGLNFDLQSASLEIFPGVKQLLASVVDMQSFVGIFLQVAIGMIVGASVYIGISYLLKIPEVHILKGIMRRFRPKDKPVVNEDHRDEDRQKGA